MLLLSELQANANRASLMTHSSKQCSQEIRREVSAPTPRKRVFKSLTDLSKEPTACTNTAKRKKVSGKQQADPRKPVRTRSAYNFFYQYQRKLLLKSMYEADGIRNNNIDTDHVCSKENEDIYKEVAMKTNIKEVHTLLRAQMTELFGTLPVARKKRQHRKTHGKIEMEKLTKLVALRWKNASQEVRSFFQIEADKDSARYKIEMRQYESRLAKERKEIATTLSSEESARNCDPQVSPRVVTPTQPVCSNSTITSKSPVIWKKKPIHPKIMQASDIKKHNNTLIGSASHKPRVTFLPNLSPFIVENESLQNEENEREMRPPATIVNHARGSFFGYHAIPENVVSLAPLRPTWHRKGLNFNFVAKGYFFD